MNEQDGQAAASRQPTLTQVKSPFWKERSLLLCMGSQQRLLLATCPRVKEDPVFSSTASLTC